MAKALILIGLLMVASEYADADNKTIPAYNVGSDIYDFCRNDDNRYSSGMCLGFIEGVSDTTQALQIEDNACYFLFPAGPVRADQLVDIVRRYLADHPEKRQLNAATLVINALQTAWPCH